MTTLATMEKPAYLPVGAAAKLWKCRDGVVLSSGPTRTGKSRALLEKAYLAGMKYPGTRILICRKTRASMSESVLQTFEDEVLQPGSPLLTGASRSHRTQYILPNGSSIIIAGLDQPTRILSSEYDMILVFEATECLRADIETLLTRLSLGRMPYQQLIMDCNPANATHWLKVDADAGRLTHITSTLKDNPKFWDGFRWTDAGAKYNAIIDKLTGVRRLRMRDGIWATAEGIVYEGWNPSIHVVDRFPIPAEWPKYRAIDFGHTNQFVCQWWAMDPDGRLYLYREICGTHRIVSDWAKIIDECTADEAIQATISDHDAEDRATLASCGISTVPAFKDVIPGIQAVQERLKVASDGRPRMFVMRDSTSCDDSDLRESGKPIGFLAEIDGYVWAPAKEGKAEKEEPTKVNDHAVDCGRYLICHIDRGATCGVGFAGGTKPTEPAQNDGWGVTLGRNTTERGWRKVF